MPICASCGQDNPDVAKFCLACGAPLDAPAEPSARSASSITVLFTDIVGSTAKAEQMRPRGRARAARALLRAAAHRARALRRHGREVHRRRGRRALRRAGRARGRSRSAPFARRSPSASAIDELNAEDEWLDLQVRIGVNTGEALVVARRAREEGEGIASGDVMNTAARIQSAAPVDGILVGELTYRGDARRDRLPRRRADRREGQVGAGRVWEAVEREGGGAHAARPTPSRSSAASVSSSALLGACGARDRRATARRRSSTIVGPPGIGKSRLLAEFARRAGRTGASTGAAASPTARASRTGR